MNLNVLQGCMTIQLNKGMNCLIDAADFGSVSRYRWLAITSPRASYAMRKTKHAEEVKETTASMHRMISGSPAGLMVDHRDGDTLNNTRANLRTCTRSENQRNLRRPYGASRFKGVSQRNISKRTGLPKWVASIQTPARRLKRLGTFDSQEAAARAYDEAARLLFGEFACTNADLYGNY